MRKLLLIAALLWCRSAFAGTCPTAANYLTTPGNVLTTLAALGITNCFYISAGGLDSNTGADESHAWLHSPGMANCSSNCSSHSVAAGDGFIFRGGDTWHMGNSGLSPYTGIVSACTFNGTASAPICLTSGKGFTGTSSNPIYLGIDLAWFSGGSWSRPIFDGDNGLTPNPLVAGDSVASCSFQLGNVNDAILDGGSASNNAYVIIDYFDVRGLCQSDTGQPTGNDIYFHFTRANYWLERMYFHGWTHTSYASCGGHAGCSNIQMMLAGANGHYWQVIVDGSDTDPLSEQTFPPGSNTFDVAYCVFRYTGQIINHDAHVLHDTLFEHWYTPTHPNLWESIGENSSLTGVFYDNRVQHICVDTGACPPETTPLVLIWPDPTGTDYWFGNDFFDVHSIGGNYFNVGQNGSSQGTLNLFNNTFENGDNTTILNCQNAQTHPLIESNNHFITDNGSAYTSPCNGKTSFTPLLMTHAQATAAGYTASQTFGFSPTTANSPTVGTGTNEQSICSTLATAAASDSTLSDAASACQADTRYACTYNSTSHTVSCPARTANLRPSSAAWDIGAFQFGAPPPAPIATFTPNPLAMGLVPVGLTSNNSATVTLQNTGTANLVVTAVTPGAIYSLVNNTCGTSFTLTPGSSCTFQVTASPVSAGPFSGGITFSDNAGNPDVLSITGTGTGSPAPAVTIFAGNMNSSGQVVVQ